MTELERNMHKTCRAYLDFDGIKPIVDFSEWESNFINSLKENYNLSGKQYYCLNKIYKKIER